MSAGLLQNLDSIATFASGCFAGTALYMTVGEVPALQQLGLDEHWRFFPYMFERAAASQTLFSVLAGVGGVVHGTRIVRSTYDRNLWLIAGSTFIVMNAYTILCMFPTNKIIINDNKSVKAGGESQINVTTRKELLDKWALLHLVRTVSSVASFGAMVYGLSRHSSLIFS